MEETEKVARMLTEEEKEGLRKWAKMLLWEQLVNGFSPAGVKAARSQNGTSPAPAKHGANVPVEHPSRVRGDEYKPKEDN